MANAERNQHAPELAASSRLDHAEHVANAIRPLATSTVTKAPHAIEPIELLSGQAIEITETANHAALHQLREQLLTDALKVERSAADGVPQRFEVLRWAGAVRAAMSHLVAHYRSSTGRTGRWHGEIG
jgi:hypothetical protein